MIQNSWTIWHNLIFTSWILFENRSTKNENWIRLSFLQQKIVLYTCIVSAGKYFLARHSTGPPSHRMELTTVRIKDYSPENETYSPFAAPSPALIPWRGGALGALGAFASVYSSIGAVCEGNTDTISARQVSVGLISGEPNNFLWGPKTHRNQPGDGAAWIGAFNSRCDLVTWVWRWPSVRALKFCQKFSANHWAESKTYLAGMKIFRFLPEFLFENSKSWVLNSKKSFRPAASNIGLRPMFRFPNSSPFSCLI